MKELLEELRFFTKALNALNEIPNIYRSRYHSMYLEELQQRCYEINEVIRFIENSEEGQTDINYSHGGEWI